MPVPTPHDALGASANENMAILMADLAVASVEPQVAKEIDLRPHWSSLREIAAQTRESTLFIDGFLESLKTGGGHSLWQRALRDGFEGIRQDRLWTWLADNCIDSNFLEAPLLGGGLFMRRLDAVLEIADAPFSALDVQAHFADIATHLADSKITAMHTLGSMAATATVGFAGGFFGAPTVASLAIKGNERFLDYVSRVDDFTEACSRLLLSGSVLAAADRVDMIDIRRIANAIKQLEHAVPDTRRQRVIRAGAAYIEGLCEELGFTPWA